MAEVMSMKAICCSRRAVVTVRRPSLTVTSLYRKSNGEVFGGPETVNLPRLDAKTRGVIGIARTTKTV